MARVDRIQYKYHIAILHFMCYKDGQFDYELSKILIKKTNFFWSRMSSEERDKIRNFNKKYIFKNE